MQKVRRVMNATALLIFFAPNNNNGNNNNNNNNNNNIEFDRRVQMSKAKAKKSNWTSHMKADVLECKRKALELVSSHNAPHCNSGRK